MKIRKDEINRHVFTDYDGTELHLDLRTDGEIPALLIYQGHEHYAVNEKLETLDVSNELSLEEVDTLICVLMDISEKMEGVKNGRK